MIHELKNEELSTSEIARRLGPTRKMVRKYPQCNRLERVALPYEVFCRVAIYATFATDDAKFADGYTENSCPILAMTGDLDLNSTPAMSQNITELVQNGCTFILQRHGHMTNLTAPNKVNAILLDWLNTGKGGWP